LSIIKENKSFFKAEKKDIKKHKHLIFCELSLLVLVVVAVELKIKLKTKKILIFLLFSLLTYIIINYK
jgi:hypothetical protein